MIDLPRLKAVGTGLAFGYAIVKGCDKRFQAHCRRHPGQLTAGLGAKKCSKTRGIFLAIKQSW